MKRLLSFSLVLVLAAFALADDAPSTPTKTGEIDLTFTERSPLSTKKELARRLNLKESEMGNDYDLSQRPFKAYIPATTQPATRLGIFVYLGYKNSVTTPPAWRPILDKSNLIFITPVCHSGTGYPPAVPMWQSLGLAFDAVHNLKKQYAINERRIYQMSWDAGSTQIAIVSSDVFTGSIVTLDANYYQRLMLASNKYVLPQMTRPPADFFPAAERHPIFLIDANQSPELGHTLFKLKMAAMKQEGFAHVQIVQLDLETDLHYPNLLPEWFGHNALPFLDASASAPPAAAKSAVIRPAPAGPSEAERLFSMAKLYIANNRPDLARQKLQQILDKYPDDPVAPKAKDLLSQTPDRQTPDP